MLPFSQYPKGLSYSEHKLSIFIQNRCTTCTYDDIFRSCQGIYPPFTHHNLIENDSIHQLKVELPHQMEAPLAYNWLSNQQSTIDGTIL